MRGPALVLEHHVGEGDAAAHAQQERFRIRVARVRCYDSAREQHIAQGSGIERTAGEVHSIYSTRKSGWPARNAT